MSKETGLEHATDSEVEAGIRALSDADALRLRRVADYRARMLVGLGLGMGAEDLLQEAICRSVSGKADRRRWSKKVSFVKHLMETMRSIANHAPDELKGGTVVAVGSNDAAGESEGVVLTSTTPDGLRVAAINEQIAVIAARFADDDEVGLVLEGLANGMKGPEIQQDLGITETQYETIMVRLRRGVDREAGWTL